jgi:hypothetical protein
MSTQLTSAQITSLHTELTTDPLGLGYAAQISAGSDNGCCALINAATGAGAATITPSTVDRSIVYDALIPLSNVINGLSATIQAKYNRMLPIILSNQTINITSPHFVAMLTAMVTDGVVSSAAATAFGQRIGSRAEVLFGAGVVIQNGDVSFVLRGY